MCTQSNDARSVDERKGTKMYDEVTQEDEDEYYQLQRELDALYYEVGERVWFELVLGDVLQ